jgi:hypothetical protein
MGFKSSRFAGLPRFGSPTTQARHGLNFTFLVELDRPDAQIFALNPFDPVDPEEFRIMVYDAAAEVRLQKPEVVTILEQLRGTLCATEGLKCTPVTTEDH